MSAPSLQGCLGRAKTPWLLVLLCNPRIDVWLLPWGHVALVLQVQRRRHCERDTRAGVDCVKPLAGTLRAQWDENVNSFEIIESLTDVSLSKHY